MNKKIIDIFKQTKESISLVRLAELLNITSENDYKMMLDTLKELENQNLISSNHNNSSFFYLDPQKTFQGILSLNRKGFGFIRLKDEIDEYFVNPNNLNNALDQDLVLFIVTNSNNENGKKNFEAKIIKVLKRTNTKIVGTIILDEKNNQKILKIQNIKLHNYLIKINNYDQAIINSIVEAKIITVHNNVIDVEIINILGNVNDPGIDILGIISEFNIRNKFPEEVLIAAKNIKNEIILETYKKRKDLTKELFVTIDGADAKDLDDAINVKKLNNNNYKLLVAIADVAHYVPENSIIDQEAFIRGNSVYLADRVIPMLPAELSNDICSLNANQPRLVVICEMEINSLGKTVDYKIYEAIINVKKRLTYDWVNQFLISKNKENNDLTIMLLEAQKLFHILRKFKNQAGVVDFDLKEAKVIINELGKVKDIVIRERKTAEMIIENFMIRANETVAEAIFWLDLPFLYRIHEQPKVEKLRTLYKLLKLMGFNIKGKIDHIYSKDLQTALAQVANNPAYEIIATLFLRSMEKAKYSNINKGHFGLASKCYTHFTSPIRRYSDLVVHQALKKYLLNKPIIDKNILQKYNEYLIKVSDQTSICEVKATECERAVEQMKKAEYMEQHINKQYSGLISSVTNFGLFIVLENTIEGFISLSDLNDDYYVYHEESLSLIGQRKRKQYRIGQKINIIVKNASKNERKIDFILFNENKRRKKWK